LTLTYDVAPGGSCYIPIAWLERSRNATTGGKHSSELERLSGHDLVVDGDPRIARAAAEVAGGRVYPPFGQG